MLQHEITIMIDSYVATVWLHCATAFGAVTLLAATT